MRWVGGTKHSPENDNRMSNLPLSSYTLHQLGSKYYAEANFDGGVDYESSTSPSTVINNAIAGLSSGVVFIKDGDWTETGYVNIYMKNGVDLIGESREGTKLGSTTNFYIVRFNSVSNSSLKNLNILNGGGTNIMTAYIYGASPSNIEIDNVHFTGTATWAINGVSAENIRIRNCLCDSNTIGQFFYNSGIFEKTIIADNVITDTTVMGVYSRGLKDSSIHDNILTDAGSTSADNAFITVANNNPSCNYSISKNRLRFTTDPTATTNGILIAGESSDTNYNEVVVVDGNTCYVEAGVTSNVNQFIYTHGYDSAHHQVRNVTIKNNIVYGAGTIMGGIVSTLSDHINYTGNIIDTVEQRGIQIDDADYVKLGANIIRNYDQAAGGYAAIDLTNSPVNVVGDGAVQSYTPADLSGAADTHYLMSPEQNVCLLNAYLKYTEASSADAGITLILGKESDDDYYYTGTSETDKAQWYTKTLTLLKRDLAAGDTLIFNSAGGKANAGEVICVVDYAFID